MDFNRLYHRIVHLLRPAVQTAPPDETGKISRVQVKFNNVETKTLNHMQQVGLVSVPPIGTDYMVANVAGDNSNGVIVASGNQTYRPANLAGGETMLYDCQAFQQSIKLRADGAIVVTGFHRIIATCDTEMVITTPLVRIIGDLHVSGAVIAGFGGGDQVGLQTHIHGQPNDSDGDGQPPTNQPSAGS